MGVGVGVGWGGDAEGRQAQPPGRRGGVAAPPVEPQMCTFFSPIGSCVNIWAPGSSVLSASHTSDTGSRSLSGTSMACPHVSGAAALILSADPTMKSSAVLRELTNNAFKGALSGLKSNDVNVLLHVGY